MDSTNDGPALALQTPGLPLPGATYAIGNDLDVFAWCRWNATVIPVLEEGQPNKYFDIENTFSTKPVDPRSCFCKSVQVEDPLLEPVKVSGDMKAYQEEAVYDRLGAPVVNSSWEQIRGPQNEWDRNRPAVTIEGNVPSYATVALADALMDYVNSMPMWGYGKRCVKLSSRTFKRQFYQTCYVYYTLTLNFDIRPETFDRDLLDEGTKVLNGHWDPTTGNYINDAVGGSGPNPNDPTHFIRFKDRNNENCRVILNGAGNPAGVAVGTAMDTYVSVSPSNLGNPLTDETAWRLVTGSLSNVTWSSTTVYDVGNIVRGTDSSLYIAESVNVNAQPPASNAWLFVAGNLNLPAVNYSATVSYNRGDVVNGPPKITTAGNVHVEKYLQADLLTLLGLPTVF